MNELKPVPLEHLITLETCLRIEMHKSYKKRNQDSFWRKSLKQQLNALRFIRKQLFYKQ